MSSTPDGTFDDPQRVIADLHRQLASRTAERDEALAREAAAAEVLQVINASPGDLAPVFDAILEKALRLCGAAFGMLALYKGDDLHQTIATRGLPPDIAELLREPVYLGPETGLGRLVRGEPIVHIVDAAAADARSSGSTIRRMLVDRGDLRTYLAVPLLRENAVFGAFTIFRQEVRPFTDQQIALVESFAAQAVIAMENARLLGELRGRTRDLEEALEYQTATSEVLKVISRSAFDLQPVLDALVATAARLCHADLAHVTTRDGDVYRVAASFAHSPEWDEAVRKLTFEPGRGTLVGRTVVERGVVHLSDIAADPEYALPEVVAVGKIRTLLGVPLLRDGEPIGVISLARSRVEPFSERQIELVRTFADQAMIAIENACLITETREAFAQQTATAEVLQVINSSPGDLAPVFEAMLEKALRLCGAEFGMMNTYDGEHFHHAADRGVPADYAMYRRRRGPMAIETATTPARLLAGENVVHTVDLMATERYEHGDPTRRALVDLGRARSHLSVALRKGDTLLGEIGIYRQEVQPFSDKQIALLQNFAAQAVIAIENARLLTETREALEQQTATAEVLQVINSSPGDLAPVFDAILEKALALCDAVHGHLYRYDGDLFHPLAVRGEPPFVDWMSQRGSFRPEPGSPLCQVLAGELVIHFADATESDAYRSNPRHRDLIDVGHIRSGVVLALHKDGVLIGTLHVFRQEVRLFSDKQIALLGNFAAQAAVAMENARLITETREALEQQTATAEVLQVINSSPGDLTPVFDAILEKAHSLCGSTHGAMATFDGERFRAVATHGLPEAFVDLVSVPFLPSPGSLEERLVLGDAFVHIPDVAALEALPDNPISQAAVDLTAARTVLLLPLRKDGALLGYISSHRREVRPFSENEIALLQNFAAQAVIAMENARLITETREALEQQTATAEVLQVINSSPGDLAPVFEAILEKAHRLCGTDIGTLYTYDGECLRPVAATGAMTGAMSAKFKELMRDGLRPGPGNPLARVIEGESLVHIADVRQVAAKHPDDPGLRVAVELGRRTQLFVPLRKDDKLLGAITANRLEVRPFSEKQIALLQNFAAQAVIAMENARLLGELRQRTEEVAELNRGLEARVADQVEELGRVGRLKRFLAPQLAEMIVSQGDEKILESHRREIVVVFCDLRGYTAFTETAEPEEVLDFLREYHGALGPLVSQFEGTLDQFSGDGIMVFFNDPVPIPDPAQRAVNMAMAMREAASALISSWRRLGRDLGFGAGIAQGYATLGQIGFSERSGYTAIGTVCNVAARLCAEAKDGQILISQRVAARLDNNVALEDIGSLTLKGLTQPVLAYNVPLAAGQPALRIIEGGPQSV